MNKENKTRISLETAKLLKDCGVESNFYFAKSADVLEFEHLIEEAGEWCLVSNKKEGLYPAYTWQEILWEHHDKFLEFPSPDAGYILARLQEGKFEEAEEFFVRHCPLIEQNGPSRAF